MGKILQGNCLDVLKTLDSESVNMCVTSPPYYGLRDYGTGTWVGGNPDCPHRRMNKYSESTITGHAQEELRGNVGDAIYKTVCPLCGAVREDMQVGLEETPEEYIDRLVNIFREVKRVMKDDGTLWVNIGDSYAGNSSRGTKLQGNPEFNKNRPLRELTLLPKKSVPSSCKPKDLIGIPWMLAFALRADGWYLRQDIIWQKVNPMPESVEDRCTKSHEYLFLFAKNPKYYFDYESIQEPCVSDLNNSNIRFGGTKYGDNSDSRFTIYSGNTWRPTAKRRKRDVWTVPPANLKEAHFAVMPERLVEPCILAGCPKGGVVLDPFFGSGTTGVVSKKLRRDYVGVELNTEYVEMAKNRIDHTYVQYKLFD